LPDPAYDLPLTHRLKSRAAISLLFTEGKSLVQEPLRLVYRQQPAKGDVAYRIAFSVSKRNHPKATDRNRIKRLLREGFRLEQHQLQIPEGIHADIICLYQSKKPTTFNELKGKFHLALERLSKELERGL